MDLVGGWLNLVVAVGSDLRLIFGVVGFDTRLNLIGRLDGSDRWTIASGYSGWI